MISSSGLPMVRQTFSRPATYLVTVSEKSIVNPIMRPEYRYTAPTPVGSGVMISSLSFEPIMGIERLSLMCRARLRISST
jgi:hypothetical protein